ncbi:MAG: 23S rRNA (pseudouridine(1915)-N(3))-methyltransferase RlmH [Burkholderiaceae bacterium]|jgi:23S rRNA (pseudouridine1915-N3)-methyltransferase
MQLVIVAVGVKMPAWIEEGVSEYLRRMPSDLRTELREVKPESRTLSRTVPAMLALEAERIRAAIPKRAVVVVLDERGRDLDTIALAAELERWRQAAPCVAFVIGGPDGIDAELKSEAAQTLRLSSLTLPHALVRVLLAEQLYRAWSVTQNHPYHRA